MPRIRFSIRSLMIVVALTAIALGLVQRRAAFQRTAHDHAQRELYNDLLPQFIFRHASDEDFVVEDLPGGGFTVRPADTPEATKRFEYRRSKVQRAKLLANYHGLLKRKYEKAAATPWILLGPDPVPPE